MIRQILGVLVFLYIAYWLYLNIVVRTRNGQRSIIVRFGKLYAIHNPGLAIKLPGIDKVITFDLAKEMPNWRGLSEAEIRERLHKKVVEMIGA